MSNISSTDSISSSDITNAATSLLALKHGHSTKDTSSPRTLHLESARIAPMVTLAKSSGWTSIFHTAKYELRTIRELVRSVVFDTAQSSDFPNIEMTFERMQRMYSSGYVVIQHSIGLVLNELRQVLQHSFYKKVSDGSTTTDVHYTMFAKVLVILNRYESSSWEYLTKYQHTSSSSQELQKFSSMVRDIKHHFDVLLPTQRDTLVAAVANNTVCMQQTGLLAKHAFSHVSSVLHDLLPSSAF